MQSSKCGIGSGGVLKPDARSLKPVRQLTNHESRTTNPEKRIGETNPKSAQGQGCENDGMQWGTARSGFGARVG